MRLWGEEAGAGAVVVADLLRFAESGAVLDVLHGKGRGMWGELFTSLLLGLLPNLITLLLSLFTGGLTQTA